MSPARACSQRIGVTALYVLPSTAGLASGFWDEQLWHESRR